MSDESNKSIEPDNAQASATATVRKCTLNLDDKIFGALSDWLNDSPTQDEMIQFVATLHRNGLMLIPITRP